MQCRKIEQQSTALPAALSLALPLADLNQESIGTAAHAQTCRVAAVGWELNNIPENYTHLEEAEKATAKSLKALRPGMKIGVTRNTVVVTTFWDSAKKAMLDPATQDYWLQCGGDRPCEQKWGLDEPCPPPPPPPMTPTGQQVGTTAVRKADGPSRCDPISYLFNWSNPRLQDWVSRCPVSLLADSVCWQFR